MPCLNPRRLHVKGLAVSVSCHQCKNCKKDKVRDLVGRLLAESLYCVGSNFITMTYGVDRTINGASDVPGSISLTYSHVQAWLKKLRDAGYPLRYVVAGEYGSKKSRAHWHLIAYWLERVPPIPDHVTDKHGHSRCWADPWWPHGHTQWAEVEQGTARYVAKYMLKDEKDKHSQGLIRRSTHPLIGARYFDEWARRHVEQGVPIQSRKYWVDGSIDPHTGKMWEYYMNPACARYVALSFERQWKAKYGHLPRAQEREWRTSPFIEGELDKVAVVKAEFQPERRTFMRLPHVPTPNGEEVQFDQVRNTYYFVLGRTKDFRPSPEAAVVFFWSFDENGERCWSPDFVSEAEGSRRWREYVRSLSPEAYAEGSGSALSRSKR